MGSILDNIELFKLKKINNPKGDIWHGLKKSEPSFIEFGEAYFSFINKNEIKGRKMHKEATLNFIVPVGEIKFILHDGKILNKNLKNYKIFCLGEKNFSRLTIPPNIWVSFLGLKTKNILLNISSKEHDPQESENRCLKDFPFNFSDKFAY